MVGGYVVQFIQRPLYQALATYYDDESVKLLDGELEKIKASGQAAPWTTEEIRSVSKKEHLLPNEVYVDTQELLQELKKAYPEQFHEARAAPASRPSRRE